MLRIGIDIGGTFLKAGVVTEEGEILATASLPTAFPRPATEIVADVARVAREAASNAGISFPKIGMIGCGCPGAVNGKTGVVEFAGNLGFKQTPLAALLSDLFYGKPVYIENDANAAMLGEWKAGAARGATDALCVTLGTGVGGGVIVGGKLLRGCNFAGAELGHTVTDPSGPLCHCGRHGCWETTASVTALIRQTKAAMEADRHSRMWEVSPTLEQVNGKTAWDGMRLGDETAKRVVDAYIGHVAVGLVNMVNLFQPDVLCIGGAISKEGEALLAPLREIVEKERFSQYSDKQTKLCRCTLGNDAGIIGAAFLDQV